MTVQRILLVEDDEGVGPLLEHVLVREGYHVDLAPTLAEAWAYLRAESYALVIADCGCPMGAACLSPMPPRNLARRLS